MAATWRVAMLMADLSISRSAPIARPVMQGSRLLRWALCEAIQHQPAGTRPRAARDAIVARRGPEARNIAKTAAARVLLTQVFYAMRDGHVRRAQDPAA